MTELLKGFKGIISDFGTSYLKLAVMHPAPQCSLEHW